MNPTPFARDHSARKQVMAQRQRYLAWLRRTVALILILGTFIFAAGGKTVESSPAEMPLAAPFAAKASVSPQTQFLKDQAGTLFTFTIRNTGTSASIGAVEIDRPSNDWSILGCPLAPAGWTIATASTTQCRYASAVGTADDIQPGQSNSSFQVLATASGGNTNYNGTWQVIVSKSNQFDSLSLTNATAETPGLTVTVYSFEILDAVVASAPVAPDSPCPAPNKAAIGGATVVIIICGKNRTNRTLTPTAAQASLAGTFIATSGTFSSGPIARDSSSSVVLGNWQGAKISSAKGTGKTVITKVGASNNQTSPLTTLTGYEVLNQAPTASNQNVTTNEDTAKVLTLSGSDADGDALSFSIVTPPTKGGLGSIGAPLCSGIAPNNCAASVTYTPTANLNGADSFVYQVSDGFGGTVTATVGISITPVNDAPSFTSGGTVTVIEDSGAYSAPWATSISPGPSDESAQTLQFMIQTNSNPSLFSVAPSIASNGTLSFTPAANANGTATLSVVLKDDGGTANGGIDTSAPVNFNIVVTAVNDLPSFTKGADQTVLEDAGAQNVSAWATAISAGPPDEAGQTLSFMVTNDNNALFSAQPAVSALTGNLTYTPAANANGSAIVTVKLQDNGGTANGGVDTSAPQTFKITVTAVNDAPSFTLPNSPDQNVLNNVGAQTVNGFATNISAGPPDESGQSLQFIIQNDNPSLFSVLPSIDATTGNLTYTPSTSGNGTATLTVTLKDNGGTANSGVDTSPSQSFQITITPPNTPPVASDNSATTNEDTAKAVTLSASDIDGDTLTFAIVTPPANGLLGTIGSVSCSGTTPNNCTASVTYTPTLNFNGIDTFTYKANDGTADSITVPITFTVTAVNDAPSFTSGGTLTVTEDSGAYSAPWATSISPGPSDESGQTLQFMVQNNSNPSLFSVAPSIAADGTLSFTPAANASGTATLTIVLKDDGGTANGGIDTSAPVNFDIVITAVNDAPVLTVPAAQTVNEDTDLVFSSGNGNAISVSDVDAGSNPIKLSLDVVNGTLTLASTTGLTFVDSTSNGQAAVHVTGSLADISSALNGLKYRAPLNFNSLRGSEQLTIVAADQGNVGSGGPLTDTNSIVINVTPVNDPPVALPKAYNAQANMPITISGGSGLLVGATDPDTGDLGYTAVFTVGTVSATSPSGGIVTVNSATGAFDFTPPPGAVGNVTFTYTVCDSGNPAPSQCSAPATVTFTVAGPVIWFVDATNGSDTTGNGTLTSPFQTIAKVDTVDAANQSIFLYSGTYANGITLNSNENLIGQGVTGTDFDTVFGITPPSGTAARPSINGTKPTVQGTIALTNGSSGNTIRGMTLSPTGTALIGTNFGTLTLNDLAINSGGTAFNLATGTLTATITSVSSAGGTNNVSLTGIAGTLTMSAGAWSGASGDALLVNGGAANITYNGTINNSTARPVNISNKTGGTVALGGAITGTSNGILLSSNTGATINFTGGLSLSTGANDAFTATGGGTINATQNNSSIINTLTTTTGQALKVANTIIGASGLTFRSISSSGGTNNGITLDTTGAGSFTITGSGTAASGGTIQNKLGADGNTAQGIGIYLNAVSGAVSLTRINIQGHQNYGIRGIGVSGGFTLDNSTIGTTTKNGTNALADQNNADSDIGGEGSIRFNNLTGTATISNSTLDNGFARTVYIHNNTGTLNLSVTDSTLRQNLNNTNGGDPSGNTTDALFLDAVNNATANLTVSNSTFDAYRQNAILTRALNTATMDISVTGSNFSNGNTGNVNASGSLKFDGSGTDVFVRFVVSGNTFRHGTGATAPSNGGAHLVAGLVSGAGKFDGQFLNNAVGVSGIPFSGAGNGADALRILTSGNSGTTRVTGTTHSRFLVKGNTIKRYGEVGIQFNAREGNGIMDATVLGNTINEPGAAAQGAFAGIWVNAGALPADTNIVHIAIGSASNAADKNTMQDSDPNNFSDVFLDKNSCGGCASQINLYQNGATPVGASTEDKVRSVLVADNNPTLDLLTGFTNGSTITLVPGLPDQPN